MDAYKKFTAEITGPKKKEYKDLLHRLRMKTTKVWYTKVAGKDYVFVIHDAEDDVLERLKEWDVSTHPFDIWFREELKKYYENFTEPVHLLFQFDV